jgi:hypothetical protein
VRISLSVKDFPGFVEKFAQRARPTLIKAVQTVAIRAAIYLQNRTTELQIMDTGRYRRSWTWANLRTGAKVFNRAPYSPVIEYGRRAGSRMPPTGPIARWAQRKLGLSAKDAKNAAFAIAKSIAKRGIPAQRVMTDPAVTDTFQRFLKEEVDRAMLSAAGQS